MKRIFTCLLFLACGISMIAQSQRTVFLEEFTQASCPPCEATTPALNTMIEANSDKVIDLRYQVWWPGVDPMYEDNTEEVDTRVAFYNVTGVPYLLKDGIEATGLNENLITQAEINARYNTAAPVLVSVTHEFNESSTGMNIIVTIKNEGTEAYDFASDKLYVAILEEVIAWPFNPGSTSIRDYESVFKKFVTSDNGMDVEVINPGDSLVVDFTDAALPDHIYDYNQLNVVAWVQDASSLAVMNAGKSERLDIFTEDVKVEVMDLETDPCAAAWSATLRVINTGMNASEVFDVVALSGGNQTILVADQTINSGDTIDFDLAGLPVPAGGVLFGIDFQNSTGFASLTNSAVLNDITEEVNTVVVDGGSAVVQVDFEALQDNEKASGLGIINTSGNALGYMFTGFRNDGFPAGGMGESDVSMIVNFWQWNPASLPGSASMEMYNRFIVPAGGGTLTFDHAFTTWQGSNDRLQIQIATTCRGTYTTVFDQAGATLRTAPEINLNDAFFIPSSADHWRHTEISLAGYEPGDTLMVRLVATSAWGDMLYIDNLQMEGVSASIDIPFVETFNIFPNPVTDELQLRISSTESNRVEMHVKDPLGRIIENLGSLNLHVGDQSFSTNVGHLPAGLYFIELANGNGRQVQRMLKL